MNNTNITKGTVTCVKIPVTAPSHVMWWTLDLLSEPRWRLTSSYLHVIFGPVNTIVCGTNPSHNPGRVIHKVYYSDIYLLVL